MAKSKRDRVKPNCPVCGDINIRASPNNNSASCRPCKGKKNWQIKKYAFYRIIYKM